MNKNSLSDQQLTKFFVTGAAGFIGFHLSRRLIDMGFEVAGIDNINDYYDINLKYDRLKELGVRKEYIDEREMVESNTYSNFRFVKGNLEDGELIGRIFSENKIDVVVNLAAQAGVRYSLENPQAYIESNIVGFMNILEACRHSKVKHLVYASSSSVYGLNEKMPLSTSDNVDHPISLYAATKKSNELMAHTYSHLYGLPTTGLRFFTVYGPWGRPDMAYYSFTKAAFEGEVINVFNYGEMSRDFTYIDDIIEGMIRILPLRPEANSTWTGKSPDPASSKAPYRIYNIGNNHPIALMDFIQILEAELGVDIKKNMMEMQPGDVPKTYADVSDLGNEIGYTPDTDVKEGIRKFIEWYMEYYGLEAKRSKVT